MKQYSKLMIPFVVMFFCCVFVFAENRTIYVQPKFGLNIFSKPCAPNNISCKQSSVAMALLFGYKLTNNLSLEATYTYEGRIKATYTTFDSSKTAQYEAKFQSFSVSSKMNWNLMKDLDFSTKGGVNYWFGNQVGMEVTNNSSRSDSGITFLLAAGLEYELSKAWSLGTEYQYVDKLGGSLTGQSNLYTASVGLTYYFGVSQPDRIIKRSSEYIVNILDDEEEVPVLSKEFFPDEKLFNVKKALVEKKLEENFRNAQNNYLSAAIPSYAGMAGPFNFNKRALLPKKIVRMKRILKPLIKRLKANPKLKVTVVGYTDASGDKTYNYTLSLKRAQGIARYLKRSGISRSRITIIGAGELAPQATNDTVKGRQRNRRVEVYLPLY